jgi:hypothetical protein
LAFLNTGKSQLVRKGFGSHLSSYLRRVRAGDLLPHSFIGLKPQQLLLGSPSPFCPLEHLRHVPFRDNRIPRKHRAVFLACDSHDFGLVDAPLAQVADGASSQVVEDQPVIEQRVGPVPIPALRHRCFGPRRVTPAARSPRHSDSRSGCNRDLQKQGPAESSAAGPHDSKVGFVRVLVFPFHDEGRGCDPLPQTPLGGERNDLHLS